MDTRRHTPAGTFPNYASQSADGLEEDNYMNTARRTVDKPSEKKCSYLNHLLIITVSWGILLLIMVPRIHLTHVLSENIAGLTIENWHLEMDRRHLKEEIAEWKQGSIARAQAIVDAYCPQKGDGRTCSPCENGWQLHGSSCYLKKDLYGLYAKTWEEAREECRGKDSDLAQDDLRFVGRYYFNRRRGAIWIGLKAENGRWKLVNGSHLPDDSSLGPPLDGLCVVTHGYADMQPQNCSDTEGWVCAKQALSLESHRPQTVRGHA